ncbi:hypothetical protein Hanom_Chr03g00272521 [Helianthus anomalus]
MLAITKYVLWLLEAIQHSAIRSHWTDDIINPLLTSLAALMIIAFADVTSHDESMNLEELHSVSLEVVASASVFQGCHLNCSQ